jgi:hypothetical protein
MQIEICAEGKSENKEYNTTDDDYTNCLLKYIPNKEGREERGWFGSFTIIIK